ncbi:helix-turn-helix domain-containing protein [Alicyclobacillus tolerans]|uniref:helix-turn-helix domain-containing protein n=1 Tax=Alicyclobacillus TaxID=29330 RepID=UPI001932F65F|nr:helix-turn-helix transcriptional regulator [Alicyclobacillus sp. TC]QRF24282.1 helix-turn-helix transcriptional regulator [Alicyclobacillus sp. TC]
MSLRTGLEKRRKEMRLSQFELAKGLTSQSHISLLERGLVKPSNELAEALSQRLCCSVEQLFAADDSSLLQGKLLQKAWHAFLLSELSQPEGLKELCQIREDLLDIQEKLLYQHYLISSQSLTNELDWYDFERRLDCVWLIPAGKSRESRQREIQRKEELQRLVVDAATRRNIYAHLGRMEAADWWSQQECQLLQRWNWYQMQPLVDQICHRLYDSKEERELHDAHA